MLCCPTSTFTRKILQEFQGFAVDVVVVLDAGVQREVSCQLPRSVNCASVCRVHPGVKLPATPAPPSTHSTRGLKNGHSHPRTECEKWRKMRQTTLTPDDIRTVWTIKPVVHHNGHDKNLVQKLYLRKKRFSARFVTNCGNLSLPVTGTATTELPNSFLHWTVTLSLKRQRACKQPLQELHLWSLPFSAQFGIVRTCL